MESRQLPQALEGLVLTLEPLGPKTQNTARDSLKRLWFDAAKKLHDSSVFISTGDIPAMWIRDSVWQVRPLLPLVSDPEIQAFVLGVIQRQVMYLGIDPYANAFNIEPNGACWHKDFEDQSPWVFERKFELDSWTGFLQLSLDLLSNGVKDHLTEKWWEVVKELVSLMEKETQHEPKSYRFTRPGNPSHDHLSHDGFGAPHKNCGLIWSGFRPSDDAVELPFHIPSNIHAAIVLQRLAEAAKPFDKELAGRASVLAQSLGQALESFGVAEWQGKQIWAYEVDGLGNQILMDDANYPSLLSLPMLGYQPDQRYQNTRDFVWSKANPWFFEGYSNSGIGSPHTGQNMVWPLATAIFGITATTPQERLTALRSIEQCLDESLFIHESLDVSDPSKFTRDWFSWAEMTYVEVAMSCAADLRQQSHPGESNS